MIRRLGICFLVLLCSIPALAINATVAHTLFYTRAEGRLQPNVEVSWQITPQTVHYKTNAEQKIVARIRTDIVFTTDTGVIREHHFILQTVPRADVNELTAPIIDLRRYPLSQGLVRVSFTLTDMTDSNNTYVFADTFTVPPVPEKPFYSELQLLDTLFPSSAQTLFAKNGNQQIPASSNFLDDNKTSVHYYAELYQSDLISQINYPLVQRVFITKTEHGHALPGLQKTDTIKSPQQMIRLWGRFALTSLASGNYYLYATLENSTRQTLAESSLFFQRLNKHPTIEDAAKKAAAADTGLESITVLNLNKTFLAKYDMAQVKAILRMILPLCDPMNTSTINNFLKNPDDLYMRYFVYNFFVAVNKNDPTKAWKEYSEKVLEVNKRFSARGTPGYVTERGFMYLRYGPPTDIITVSNETGALPYEIWQYNTLTQTNRKEIPDAVFLFYKANEINNDYRLLHSNVAGEVQNKAWRSYLYLSQQGPNNSNSRAEQYIGDK